MFLRIFVVSIKLCKAAVRFHIKQTMPHSEYPPHMPLRMCDLRDANCRDSGSLVGMCLGVHDAPLSSANAVLCCLPQEFDLSNNGIGARTCLVLGEALRCNKSLRVLILDHNPLGEEGGMHLMSALTHNRGLTRLGLHNVSFVDVAEVDDRGYRRMLFNRAKPNGKYTLDLSNPTDRQIATELVRLRAESGAASWRDVRLKGKPFSGPAERDGWPERMPETGRLELRYDTEAVPLLHPEVRPMGGMKGACDLRGACGPRRSGDGAPAPAHAKMPIVSFLVPAACVSGTVHSGAHAAGDHAGADAP